MAWAVYLGKIRHMTPTPDGLTALAAELGRIGRRLDGMGAELLALRACESRGPQGPAPCPVG